MDLSNLFSGSDNLYKFLFIGGLIMLFFALIYPMQKQQLIDLEINSHNEESAVLNIEIDLLDEKVKDFKTATKLARKELDSLVGVRNEANNSIISEQIAQIKEKSNKQFSQLEEAQQKVNTKNTILDFNKKRIKILIIHSDQYRTHTTWLNWVGIIFTFFGLIFWAKSWNKTEKLKDFEIDKRKSDSQATKSKA